MRTILLVATMTLAAVAIAAPKNGFRIRGTEILEPSGRPIRILGFNAMWWVPATPEQAEAMKAMGVNTVRYMFGYLPTGKFDPEKIKFIPEQVRTLTRRGFWVIPVVHDFRKDGKGPYDSPELQAEYLDMWHWVIAQLKDEPRIAAWEPINEPHDSPSGTVSRWYTDTIADFRKLDRDRPVVVEGTGYSWPQNMTDDLKQSDRNIIYSFHTYGPFEYTHQKKGSGIEYPGKWSREDLAKAIEPALAFRDVHKVPVWCGEWGVQTYDPGYQQWIKAVFSILEEDHLPWCYWGWAQKPEDPLSDSFDVNPLKTEVFSLLTSLFRQAKR